MILPKGSCKHLCICLITLLLIAASANAIEVLVKIDELLLGNISYISYSPELEKPFHLSAEFFNSGSIAYKARIRTDIYSEDGLLYSAWSREEPLLPGFRKTFDMYWLPGTDGDYTANVRMYYANEIRSYGNLSLEAKGIPKPESAFEIRRQRTYDDHVRLYIWSNRTVDGVVVIPSEYPTGWIFEQDELGPMREGEIKQAVLPYVPALWGQHKLTVSVFTLDGKYLTSKSFLMEKDQGLTVYWQLLTDPILAFLNL